MAGKNGASTFYFLSSIADGHWSPSMSLSRIPLNQVFRAKSNSTSSNGSAQENDLFIPRDVTKSPTAPTLDTKSIIPEDITNSPKSGSPKSIFDTFGAKDVSSNTSVSNSPPQPIAIMAQPNGNGTTGGPPRAGGNRNPRMLEYERQAEERAREQDRMDEERSRMREEQDRMSREQERIAQEQYEMDQYYEAEALKHAEELRVHQEEIRRHQARVREHQMRLQDHEASSEAFARVIAMPAKPGRDRQISSLPPANTKAANGAKGGPPAQSPGA
ncbi:hypothetical protein BJ875DRAFT_511833 [Amylocarpus encephaloides]|uniref:Uncharacterized protein n=1 Tax=Amylocarpus encephaloides TaxID=45428 RepID=A0A9P7YID6_9HELO|nr:hypothetical protein BJ875DRAFT_511833 [Amylocarpus encephaloides]